MTAALKRRWFRFSLRPAFTLLLDCFIPERQRAYERDLESRVLMDDETFYQSNYGSTGIPREIPIRLRRLFAYQLGSCWEHVQPADKPTDADDNLDFAELVFDVEEEFGVSIPIQDMMELDGSFDSLVRCVSVKLGLPSADEHEQFRLSMARLEEISARSRELDERVRQLFGGEIPAAPEPRRSRIAHWLVLLGFTVLGAVAFYLLAVQQ